MSTDNQNNLNATLRSFKTVDEVSGPLLFVNLEGKGCILW